MQNVNSFFEMNNGQHNVEPNETHNAIVHMVDHIINSAIYLYNPVTDNTIVHINKQGTKNDPLIGYFTIDSVNSINLFLAPNDF